MLDDLLSYSRLRKENVKLTCVKIPEVLESVIGQLSEKHSGCNYEIKYNPDDLPELEADRNQISQLFLNLIDNALKFNHDPAKTVYINMVEDKDGYVFCISDNGIGIDGQYHDKVFRIFQKLHNTSDYEGSGIGLALCKKITENHNGNIWIESANGNGTKIFFRFPKIN
jgi:light-regulated signal transduction histidine kinase (bacteriophytochrome)